MLLAKMNIELEKLNNEKSQMVNVVAHDLKSPLSRIEGLINIINLSNGNLIDDQIKTLQKVIEFSNEQKKMIL